MLVTARWVQKPVPNLILDEELRLFISADKTFCADLREMLDTTVVKVVEYVNDP